MAVVVKDSRPDGCDEVGIPLGRAACQDPVTLDQESVVYYQVDVVFLGQQLAVMTFAGA